MVLFDLSQTDPRNFTDTDEDRGDYLCAFCETKITEQKLLINIAGDLSCHSFSNPAGFNYNILTFSYCEMYREGSPPESRDTWFPGYSWIIIYCHKCGSLLGWKYISELNTPPLFFGLIREQLILV